MGREKDADKSALERHGDKSGDVARLNRAYEEALRALYLVDRNDPITEMVAKKIIEIGQTGIDDPKRLCAESLKQLGIDRRSTS
ncbi:hypothetical protein LMTR13_09005 [Bradyrhizobium icense]|uniref:Uncharacterized protein n=1 Tax=Bradyrhizobium icense TaxID=1274631 RepID=A0A1B1UBZ7_9BRAD|nr:hypothetical protein LMTR13_09005 [Bradyrhizobium icense]